MKYILILLLFISQIIVNAQTKVVCVGASITEGALTTDPKKDSYPAQFAHLLGNNYEVINCE